jgi:pantoate--beta-alanine ligase
MVQDLLLSHPTPENLHVVPTYRDSVTGLALSSRNAYMTEQEAAFAPALYKALRSAESYWNAGATKEDCVVEAVSVIQRAAAEAATKGVDLRVDYVEMNDSGSFEILKASIFKSSTDAPKHPVIVSGAMWVGRTRLIDNVLLNEDGKLLSRR